jgi:ParB family chromosome partitioning protein
MTDDLEKQRSVAKAAMENSWSVRETERAVKRTSRRLQTTDTKGVIRTLDANVRAAENKLMRHLSTNVKIRPAKKGTGGKIEIEYYGTDDLNRIYEMLMDKEKEV